ncbi:MAG: type IV pilin protein [Pseudomonadota bacterium]
MSNTRGFTLVEMMIVIAIMGIIFAIAVPTYRRSILKSNRSDAQITLTQLATLEERYYFRENNYTGSFADIVTGATAGQPISSDEGHYSIALTLTGGGTGWSMTATAVGDQLGDSECYKLTLTSLGAKTAVNSSNAASSVCW